MGLTDLVHRVGCLKLDVERCSFSVLTYLLAHVNLLLVHGAVLAFIPKRADDVHCIFSPLQFDILHLHLAGMRNLPLWDDLLPPAQHLHEQFRRLLHQRLFSGA